MYKTVLFKGQWQKTLLGIVSEFGGFSFFPFFLLYFQIFFSETLLLIPISQHIYEVHYSPAIFVTYV